MGTDIHGVFQARDTATNTWQDIASTYNEDRHYQLFAILAGVRNGAGFAGVPIAEPRGLPVDFQHDEHMRHAISDLDTLPEWRRSLADEPYSVWMGDHSHSWLHDHEMLGWYESAPVVTKTGILSRSVYEDWDKVSEPTEYSGAIWGPDVIDDDEQHKIDIPDWTYIKCTWKSSLKDELAYFFDEVQRLHDKHGDVRYVFGFDS